MFNAKLVLIHENEYCWSEYLSDDFIPLETVHKSCFIKIVLNQKVTSEKCNSSKIVLFHEHTKDNAFYYIKLPVRASVIFSKTPIRRI